FADEIEKGLRLSKPPLASQQCFEWILRCWENNQESRPTFLECKEFFRHLAVETTDEYLIFQAIGLLRARSNRLTKSNYISHGSHFVRLSFPRGQNSRYFNFHV
ncbi:unnamed protein product, partial [Allacma fusca]